MMTTSGSRVCPTGLVGLVARVRGGGGSSLDIGEPLLPRGALGCGEGGDRRRETCSADVVLSLPSAPDSPVCSKFLWWRPASASRCTCRAVEVAEHRQQRRPRFRRCR